MPPQDHYLCKTKHTKENLCLPTKSKPLSPPPPPPPPGKPYIATRHWLFVVLRCFLAIAHLLFHYNLQGEANSLHPPPPHRIGHTRRTLIGFPNPICRRGGRISSEKSGNVSGRCLASDLRRPGRSRFCRPASLGKNQGCRLSASETPAFEPERDEIKSKASTRQSKVKYVITSANTVNLAARA